MKIKQHRKEYMKTSEKYKIIQEIAESLENCKGLRKDNIYDWAEWYEYRFDREKYDNYKDSDENLKYHDEVADRYNQYLIREDYRCTVVEHLMSNLSKCI